MRAFSSCRFGEAATCRGEEVVSLWLESGGAEVKWNYSKAPATAAAAFIAAAATAGSFRKLSATGPGGPPGLLAGAPGLGLGRVAVVAKSGLMLLLSNSPSGKLQALGLGRG